MFSTSGRCNVYWESTEFPSPTEIPQIYNPPGAVASGILTQAICERVYWFLLRPVALQERALPRSAEKNGIS
jgi:hypothetical protein